MQNNVPVERELADRTLTGRRRSYESEVRRFIDAAFTVMRETGDIDPQVREIVKVAGLSNHAFYKHFPSKDAFLLAVLGDGQRQLEQYLKLRVAAVKAPKEKVRVWVAGVMAQARDRHAAEATRPFALNATRLAARFPDEMAASRRDLVGLLAPAVEALGGGAMSAAFICDLALERMSDAIARGRRPDNDEITDLVAFCLAGVKSGA